VLYFQRYIKRLQILHSSAKLDYLNSLISMKLQAITPSHFPWFDYARYSFSLGLKTDKGAYLSGHTASEFDPVSKRIVVHGNMTDQVKTAYSKIGTILEASGMGFQDVVRIVEYVRPEGIERYAEAAAVRAEVFGAHQPTVHTVPVNSLLRPEAYIEIEVTAAPVGRATDVGSNASPARDSAGLVYLPTVQPVDSHGHIVGAGDIVAQTAYIFEKTGKMLAALGLGFNNLVKTVDYLTPSGLSNYKGTGRIRKQHLGPIYPGAAGLIMSRLVHPEALIQYDFIASRDTLECINPGWTRYEKLSYSPAVKAGRMLFMSGQGSLDPATEKVVHDNDVVAQAEYTYSNIVAVLKAAGAGPQNLVKTIEYVTPSALANYKKVAQVREALLQTPYPASTGLICQALLRPEMMIEVDPFAILD
jgi:enamine deaminase RidA (YjgF/YER057c/UK114 family)